MENGIDKRINWIDMAKGYGIFFVIIGHLYIPHISSLIYSFHMPLFFFLSGYLFKKEIGVKEFIKKKFKGIIVPYLSLGTIIILFDYIWKKYVLLESVSLVIIIKNFLVQKRTYAIWFLTCLFCVNIIFYFITHMIKSIRVAGVIVFTLAIVTLIYYRHGGDVCIWNADASLVALPFFYLGYVMKLSDSIERVLFENKKIIKFVILACLNIVFAFASYKICGLILDMYGNIYGVEPLVFLAALAGTLCVVLVAKSFAINAIAYVGANSLVYFAFHQEIFLVVINKMMEDAGLFQYKNMTYFMEIVQALITFVFIMIGTTVCTVVINNTKLRVLLGK